VSPNPGGGSTLSRFALILCMLVLSLGSAGCEFPEEGDEPADVTVSHSDERELFQGPEGDRAWPSRPRPETPLDGVSSGPIQVSIGGNPAEVFTRDGMLRVFEPVPQNPTAKYTTELKPVRRAFITLFECNPRGEITSDEAISIADPNLRTLLPNKEFSLAQPEGCIIWRKQTLDRVPLKAGGYYRMTLRVESGSGAESVIVFFVIRDPTRSDQGGPSG